MRLDLVTDINRGYAAAMNYGAIDRYLARILWRHAHSGAGRLVVSPEPGPVRDIVRKALDRVRPLAAEQRVRRDDGAPGIPE
ncbi:MAG TPA: hypothetical protein VGA35_08635 [bacterium]